MLRVLLFCVVTSLCFALLAQAKDEMDITDCGSTAVKIISISQEPDVLERGRRVTAISTAIVSKDVVGATYLLRGTRNVFGRPITLSLPKADICQLIIEEDCSLKAGRVVTFVLSQVVPKFAPRGRYMAQFEIYDDKESIVGCVRFPLDLLKGSQSLKYVV